MNPLSCPRTTRPRRLTAALAIAFGLGGAAHALAQTPAPASPPEVPSSSSLDAMLFYQLLLGELNVRGGDPGAGYSLILDAARRQKDPALYRRAVEVALQGRSGESALAAARAWSQALPGDNEADRFVLQILLALNRAGETGPVLRELLQSTPAASRNDAINAIPQTFARASDKALALAAVRDGLTPFMNQPAHGASAWTTLGRMELLNDRPAAAVDAARRGHAIDPASPYPALLAVELLERGESEAEPLIRQQIDAARSNGPRDLGVAISYARALLDLQRLRDARVQLERLTTRAADQPEPWLLLGSLQLQDRAYDAANLSLQTYIGLVRDAPDERVRRGLTQAYLLMAEIAEKQQDFVAANAWIDRIDNPQDIIAAQQRRASVLARQGRLAEARQLLREQPERRPEDARLKLLAEAQLLRDFKAWREAYEVYTEAAKRFPDDPDLLYDQALMAERAGLPVEMERLLRQLIQARPEHHHAYNALGYSLADRNERLPEAKQLIEKAVSLAPNDPYIQDSLGWVEFRLGNTERALTILREAYGKRPDAEIAAHLGEVLWVKGQRDEALRIWREGLLLANDNETLQQTLRRLNVKP
ncbi:MAG: tetratricopeptide repeat protein [Hydrogenophaga sp.]|uniref:tetratricopeptide repeat protein n=1 Tax=Hydrogenophaga intermedia TaxID=65786 RepID=UPI002042FA67|nr:tetratricopeptide repeat protein [Hydrogenophaga intermedia]MCM3565114.1 tetratricopeptide repeat protein [Hydrogenophaga intermedia]